MKINVLEVGYLKENCYILSIDNKVLIVDPGDEALRIKEAVKNKDILGILVTHSHFDHVGALSYFEGYKVYSYSTTYEKEYEVGPFKFKVIRTPGHKDDSVSFYFYEENTLFAGDFIFYEGIGRCDLEGGSFDDMQKSIDMIKKYPEDMIIYPGHGCKTVLKHEMENNPYF